MQDFLVDCINTPARLRRAALAFLAVAAVSASTPAFAQQLSANVRQQISDIYAMKATLTPAERKLSSNLLFQVRAANGTLPASLKSLVQNASQKLAVEVHGNLTASTFDPVYADVDKVNGVIPAHALVAGRVAAHLSVDEIQKLAADPNVKVVRDATAGHTNVGSFTSQGYIAHQANKAVALGVTGAGVRVGVLSDSASPSRVAALIASGDLPADTVVVPNQGGSGEDEGTAMMEIVHDIAPNAKLFFATANSTQANFAANIRTLRYTYGCDIIVDDYSYFAEAAFQDGTVAAAVNEVTADGVLYFSSAANSGNLSSGTSGTWEGDFSSTQNSAVGDPITTNEGQMVALNNFGSVNGTTQSYDVLKSSASSGVWLQWSDALGASGNDYDLYVTNSTGTTLLGVGATAQTGTQDPLEYVYTGSTLPAGSRIYVALYSGDPRALHVDTERSTLTIATTGATFGHNAGAKTFSTAAVYWNAAKKGPVAFTGGAANPNETFSSDGPRKVFYQQDGTPITAGNFLFGTNGGTTLIKPDAAGADGVSTATPGFLPFFGTSAAAPHLAGIAALVKSANPLLTNTQIRNILTGNTLDNMAPGVDRDSGYGIVSAQKAVAAAIASR